MGKGKVAEFINLDKEIAIMDAHRRKIITTVRHILDNNDADYEPDDVVEKVWKMEEEYMKVFLVESGEYSDRHPVGYCTSEEKAKVYCAIANQTDKEHYIYDEHYYEEIECLDDRFVANVEVGYETMIIFEEVNNKWELSDLNHPYWPDVISIRKSPRIFFDRSRKKANVYVWTEDENYEKAKKIAADYFYEKIAEIELENVRHEEAISRLLEADE